MRQIATVSAGYITCASAANLASGAGDLVGTIRRGRPCGGTTDIHRDSRALRPGLRFGELAPLRTSDLDLLRRTLRVDEQLSRQGSWRMVA